MIRYLLLCLLFSCGNSSRGTLRIGVDPNWYPLDFGTQVSYVNGFTEELLVELAHYSGLEFEKIPANWDTLFDGLRRNQYDAVLTSMEPYIFNTARYDFSSNFLTLGPVLIVPVGSSHETLASFQEALIGIITNDPAVNLIEVHPNLIIRKYATIPELLNALAIGEVQGALLDQIPAVNYVADLYADRLKIAGAPLNQKGLHLLALKDHSHLVAVFNKNLDAFKRKKQFQDLLKKWHLI